MYLTWKEFMRTGRPVQLSSQNPSQVELRHRVSLEYNDKDVKYNHDHIYAQVAPQQ